MQQQSNWKKFVLDQSWYAASSPLNKFQKSHSSIFLYSVDLFQCHTSSFQTMDVHAFNMYISELHPRSGCGLILRYGSYVPQNV